MLTPEELRRHSQQSSVTCFTSTKVQILTPEELRDAAATRLALFPQFICFIVTKVQILTPEELQDERCSDVSKLYVLSLLASLVQKYKY